jgi:hypothetical protein
MFEPLCEENLLPKLETITGDKPGDDALCLAGYQALLEAYEQLAGLWIVTSQLTICLVGTYRSMISLDRSNAACLKGIFKSHLYDRVCGPQALIDWAMGPGGSDVRCVWMR